MLEPNEEYHDLATLVRSKAQKNGSRVALGFPGRKLTYLELDTLSERVAAGLAAEGIGRGTGWPPSSSTDLSFLCCGSDWRSWAGCSFRSIQRSKVTFSPTSSRTRKCAAW